LDRFGGESVATVVSFEWDTDLNLQIARVLYGLGDGSRRERYYLARLGAVSENFPLLELKDRWTGKSGERQESRVFSRIEDKWKELWIRYCPSEATYDDKGIDPSVAISDDKRSLNALFRVKPDAAPRLGEYPFSILVTRRATVRVDEDAPNAFYVSDSGCQLSAEAVRLKKLDKMFQ
jgi:hypothetical protein